MDRTALTCGLSEKNGREHDSAAYQLPKIERLAEPQVGDQRAGDRLEHRDDCRASCGNMPQRTDEEEERDDCPEDDHPGHQRPDREMPAREVAVQRDVVVYELRREAPPGLDNSPEDGREQEAPGQKRSRITGPDRPLGEQDIEGV